MIEYVDLLGRAYSRDGLGPDGPLSCTGATLAILDRGGLLEDRPNDPTGSGGLEAPESPQDASGGEEASSLAQGALRGRHGAVGSPSTRLAESALAVWAVAPESPWERVPVSDFLIAPRDLDVLLLEVDGEPDGLAVVVHDRARLALTSLPRKGVVALKLRAIAASILDVYRWRAS